MERLVKSIVAGLLAISLGLGPAGAQELSPVGQWKLDAGDSHYEIEYCGDGTQICAKVIYLGPSELNDKTRPYLNTYLVTGAKPTGPHKWQGIVSLYGDKVSGTMKQIGPDILSLTGCLFIFCKSFKMFRL
jgi:uncharacterized protein (DUF2147 family)